eukprot:s183_g16.t1
MALSPREAAATDGLVVRAMRFLSGYGFHITVSCDRLVGRVLDILAVNRGSPHNLVGAFDSSVYSSSQRFCRVGLLANTIRNALSTFRSARLPDCLWGDPVHWAALVPLECGFSAVELARAVACALDAAQREWIQLRALWMQPSGSGLPSARSFAQVYNPHPFRWTGLSVHGKTPGVMVRIHVLPFLIRALQLTATLLTLLSLAMVAWPPLRRLVFAHKHAVLGRPSSIGKVASVVEVGRRLDGRWSVLLLVCFWVDGGRAA